jgi:2-(1,2-epoxy-1,2-dihydrophenyl)acetyl-CoA isomerase
MVGARRAAELMLTNRRVDAEEAERLGIVTIVVDDDDLPGAAQGLAEQIAAGPTRAFGATRRLLRATWTAPAEDQMAAEAASIAHLAATADGREGVAAFLAKRRPQFSG